MKNFLVIDQERWDELNDIYQFTDEQNKFFLDIDEKTGEILMKSSDGDVLIEAAKEKIMALDVFCLPVKLDSFFANSLL